MATFWIRLNAIRINPGECRRHHTEVQMIDHCMGIADLAFCTANFLLDLFEAGFDFPASAIVFDNLLNRQGSIGGKKSHPAGFPEDPDNPGRTAQILEHDDFIIGPHLALFSVQEDRNSTRLVLRLTSDLGS